MPRLLADIDGLFGINGLSVMSGPNARNSGSSTAVDGTEQTFDAYGDVVVLQFNTTFKTGQAARRQAGLLTALRAGNALSIRCFDPDMISPKAAGLNVRTGAGWPDIGSTPFSNGQNWSNGKGWQASAPTVAVAQPSAFDSGVVHLANEAWGHRLGLGDWLGFFPFSLGLYTVTEVVGPGAYRIWPRLRTALTIDHFATLFPAIVMRPVPNTTPPARGLVHTESATVTMIEVPDYYVRQYFTG